MKTIHTSFLLVALLGASTVLFSAESSTAPAPQMMPPMPEPTREHAWLQQFVGEWESEAEVTMAPDQPAMQCHGTESVRALGGFWVIGEGQGKMPGTDQTMSSVITLGYDPAKKKYVGTWIDSVMGTLWRYEGAVDPTGKKLVLESEGPSMTKPGTTAKYRDVTEFVSKDQRVLTSSMQNEDGTWTTFMKATYRRKK